MTRHKTLVISQAVGVAAAIVVAALVNLLSARHYRRWDWTKEGMYTLSRTTEETLSTLSEPIHVWVLSSDSEPVTLTLRHLLTAYRAKTDKLTLHFVDPDTSPAELFAAQQQLGIVAGKSADGHVVTDAIVVLVKGDKRHYLDKGELVAIEGEAELRARPQVEKALTAGLRDLVAGQPVEVCATTGHGEASIEHGGQDGLMPLAERLTKENFHVTALAPAAELEGKDPMSSCALVVVAAPHQRLPTGDIERLRLYLEGGGNLLLVSGPLPDDAQKGFVSLGLDPLFAAAGLRLRQDLVFERDADLRGGTGQGEMFLAKLERHPVTEPLFSASDPTAQAPVVVIESSSLEPLADAPLPVQMAKPAPLLTTSPNAFGMVDVFAWASSGKAPEPGPGDVPGPLSLGYAVELPGPRAHGDHGPRVVALASAHFLSGANWSNPQLEADAHLVEGAVSWLASRHVALDIPDKPSRPLGLNLTEQALQAVLGQVVVGIPLAALAAGVAIRWRRGRTEQRSRKK